MSYLMFCEHKKTKSKLVAFAYLIKNKHIQYFTMKECCSKCGKVISKAKGQS